MLKRLFSYIYIFFHAELAILHQNIRGYICVNLRQNVVQKLVIANEAADSRDSAVELATHKENTDKKSHLSVRYLFDHIWV